MLIWNGFGVLVPVTWVVCYVILNGVLGEQTVRQSHWPAGIATLIAAAVAAGLGLWLKKQPGRALIDKATGREVVLKRRDSLFFIPVLYWGPILAVIALLLFVIP